MKYLLLILVLLVAIWGWRQSRRGDRITGLPEHPNRPIQTVTRMIACSHCNMHLPEHEAVPGRRGQYCSREHRGQCEDG